MKNISDQENRHSSFCHFICFVFLFFLLVGGDYFGGKPEVSELFTTFNSFTVSSNSFPEPSARFIIEMQIQRE